MIKTPSFTDTTMKPSAYPTLDFLRTLHRDGDVYLIAFHQLSKMTVILMSPPRADIPLHPCDLLAFRLLFIHMGITIVVFFSALYLNDTLYHLAMRKSRIKGTLGKSYVGYT